MPLYHNAKRNEFIRAIPGRPEAARLAESDDWQEVSEARRAEIVKRAEQAKAEPAAELAEAKPAAARPGRG